MCKWYLHGRQFELATLLGCVFMFSCLFCSPFLPFGFLFITETHHLIGNFFFHSFKRFLCKIGNWVHGWSVSVNRSVTTPGGNTQQKQHGYARVLGEHRAPWKCRCIFQAKRAVLQISQQLLKEFLMGLFRVFAGDETLPSFVGIAVNHYEDPYKATSFSFLLILMASFRIPTP